jgi:ATP-dependent Lon protease
MPGQKSQKDNDEIKGLKEKFEKMTLPEETKKIVDQELSKLGRLSANNQEYHVTYTYL